MNEDALALRQQWEAQQLADIAESRRRHEQDMRRQDALEAAGDKLRGELATKLVGLLEALDPYVDGTMGDVSAAMASVYVKAAHELAGLYGLTRQGRRPVEGLPLPEPPVPEVVGHEEQRAAVELLRAAGLGQLAAVRDRMRRQIEAS